jgi:hypothetical protein
VRKVREGKRLLNAGQDLASVLRHLEITWSTWNRWLSRYGGVKADDAERLKELEAENARLKRLLAMRSSRRPRSRISPRENGEPGSAPPSLPMNRPRMFHNRDMPTTPAPVGGPIP